MRVQLAALAALSAALLYLALDAPEPAQAPSLKRAQPAASAQGDTPRRPVYLTPTSAPAPSTDEAAEPAPAITRSLAGPAAAKAYMKRRQRYGTSSWPLSGEDPLAARAQPSVKRATLANGDVLYTQPAQRQIARGGAVEVDIWTETGDAPVTARLVARRGGETVLISEIQGEAGAGAPTTLSLPAEGVEDEDRLALRVTVEGESGEREGHTIYSLEQEAAQIRLEGPLTDEVLGGHLKIGLPIVADRPRQVHAAVTLYTPGGRPVAYAERRAPVQPGPNEIPIMIAGTVLCDGQIEGPLVVRHVQISDVTEGSPRLLPAPTAAHQTQAYSASAWSCDDVSSAEEAFALGVY